MDVNFTNSSGTQMPLANIVESGDNYIKFSDGTAIAYGLYEMPENIYFAEGCSDTYYRISDRIYVNNIHPNFGIFTKVYSYYHVLSSYRTIPYVFRAGTAPGPVKFEDAVFSGTGIEILNYVTYDNLLVINFRSDAYAVRGNFRINYLIIGRWK